MISYFLDSSAIVKRYLPESGTPWIRQLCDPATGNAIVLGAITAVEVVAALAARRRAAGEGGRVAHDDALALFLHHRDTADDVIDLDRAILDRAIALPQRHRLRGCDAVQLATALAADRALRAANLPILTFIAADRELLVAARDEGLAVDDPNTHPRTATIVRALASFTPVPSSPPPARRHRSCDPPRRILCRAEFRVRRRSARRQTWNNGNIAPPSPPNRSATTSSGSITSSAAPTPNASAAATPSSSRSARGARTGNIWR